MSQATKTNSSGLLAEVLFENLDPVKRVGILAQTLRRTIAEFHDEASMELIRRLHDAFGLKSPISDSEEADRRNVSIVAIQIEKAQHRCQFCDLLMAAYPFGSIRKKDERAHPEANPDFMGTRKEILKCVAWEWTGEVNERGKLLFEFLRRAVGQGENKVMLLEPEKQMIFSIIRERLQSSLLFTEEVLRQWMRYMDGTETGTHQVGDTRIKWIWDEELYMLLAIARVRNGGVASARLDIALRCEDESLKRRNEEELAAWHD